jgi:putative transposase
VKVSKEGQGPFLMSVFPLQPQGLTPSIQECFTNIMATPPRYFQKNSYYHVYNRGNRKQNIFFQNKDYERFLERLREYKDKFDITILGYCLMPNHFHFLLRQESDIPISLFMLRLCTSYAKYFNIKYEEVGSLFQGRFKAKIIDSDEYLLQVSRYVHRNPLSISTPGVELTAYPWSSYAAYVNGEKNNIIDSSYILNYFSENNYLKDYKQFTEYDSPTEDEIQQLKVYIFED